MTRLKDTLVNRRIIFIIHVLSFHSILRRVYIQACIRVDKMLYTDTDTDTDTQTITNTTHTQITMYLTMNVQYFFQSSLVNDIF